MATPRRITRSFLAKMSTPEANSSSVKKRAADENEDKSSKMNRSSTRSSDSAIKRSKKVDEIIADISTPLSKSGKKSKLDIVGQAKESASSSAKRQSTRKTVVKESLTTPTQNKVSLGRPSRKRLTDVIPKTPVEKSRKRKTTAGGVENSEFGVTPIKQKKNSSKESNSSSACLTKPIKETEDPVEMNDSVSEIQEVAREFEEERTEPSTNAKILIHSNDNKVEEHLKTPISENPVDMKDSVSESKEVPPEFAEERDEEILCYTNVNESVEIKTGSSLVKSPTMSSVNEPGAKFQLNLSNFVNVEKEKQKENVSLANTESVYQKTESRTDNFLKSTSQIVDADRNSTEKQVENNVNNTNVSINLEFIKNLYKAVPEEPQEKSKVDRDEEKGLNSSGTGIDINVVTDDQNMACNNFQPTPVKTIATDVILIEDTPVPTKFKESIIEIVDTPNSPKVTQRRKVQKAVDDDVSINDQSLFERSILKRRTRRSLSTSALDTTTRTNNRRVQFSELNVTISLHDIDMRLKEQYTQTSGRDMRASRRKRSMSTTDVESFSQFKSKKMPNFSAIHNKQFREMESIVEYKRRVQEKAEKDKASSEKKRISGSSTKSRDANPKTAIQIKFNSDTKENEPNTVIETGTISSSVIGRVFKEAGNHDTAIENSAKPVLEKVQGEIQNSVKATMEQHKRLTAEDNTQIQLNTSFTCESPSIHSILPVAEQTLKDKNEFNLNAAMDQPEKNSTENNSGNDQTDNKSETSSCDFGKSDKKPKSVFGFADTKKPVNFNAMSTVLINQSKSTSAGLNLTSKGPTGRKIGNDSELRHKSLYKAGRTCQTAPKIEMKGVRLNKRFHLMMQYRKNLDKDSERA